jgi:lauroyl/myristoyl acyltransferase
MSLYEAVRSPVTIRLGKLASRHAPPRVGHAFARLAANLVSRARPAVYRIVVANVRQVLGPGAEDRIVSQTARRVVYYAVRSYYDLYHNLQRPREELIASVDYPESAQQTVREMQAGTKGTLLVVPHLGNFDLAGQALATYLPGLQVLSLADPPPGFQIANEMRRHGGIDVTPLSPSALRKAIGRLRSGGVVATGGDRPVSELDEPVPFFGRLARMPSAPVRLALKTGAQIAVAYCVVNPETHKDTLYLEPPFDLVRSGEPNQDMVENKRQVLERLETAIRRWVEQWMMFVPVWPEAGP